MIYTQTPHSGSLDTTFDCERLEGRIYMDEKYTLIKFHRFIWGFNMYYIKMYTSKLYLFVFIFTL